MVGLNYVYKVPTIIKLKDPGISGYNFNTYLDPNLAILARKEKLIEKSFNYIQESGRDILKSFFSEKVNNPYVFVEDSWLVQSILVPGDACDLSLNESGLRDFISDWNKRQSKGLVPFATEYVCHNTDSFIQAQALRELFINWANLTNDVLYSP